MNAWQHSEIVEIAPRSDETSMENEIYIPLASSAGQIEKKTVNGLSLQVFVAVGSSYIDTYRVRDRRVMANRMINVRHTQSWQTLQCETNISSSVWLKHNSSRCCYHCRGDDESTLTAHTYRARQTAQKLFLRCQLIILYTIHQANPTQRSLIQVKSLFHPFLVLRT